MNFGYLIIVSTHADIDYLKCAYAAALSIKNTQKPGYDQVALVIDNPTIVKNLKSPWVFDYVIEWNKEKHWDGRSWMDTLSPFTNTVCIDADMIFLRDYSHWIDYFIEHKDLYISNNAFTYRGEKISNDFYRKAFTKNNIPNLYSMFTFFKKNTEIATEFFTLGRYILKNPTEFKKSIHDSWLGDWLFFATDSRIQLTGFGELNGLKLPRTVIDKIYRKNAENWLSNAPSEINKN
jgi:hypothetical protein